MTVGEAMRRYSDHRGHIAHAARGRSSDDPRPKSAPPWCSTRPCPAPGIITERDVLRCIGEGRRHRPRPGWLSICSPATWSTRQRTGRSSARRRRMTARRLPPPDRPRQAQRSLASSRCATSCAPRARERLASSSDRARWLSTQRSRHDGADTRATLSPELRALADCEPSPRRAAMPAVNSTRPDTQATTRAETAYVYAVCNSQVHPYPERSRRRRAAQGSEHFPGTMRGGSQRAALARWSCGAYSGGCSATPLPDSRNTSRVMRAPPLAGRRSLVSGLRSSLTSKWSPADRNSFRDGHQGP